MTPPTINWKTWTGQMPATLLFVVKEKKILLIDKLRGIGKGKINGPGGKIDPGETALEGAIRECQEELHITPLSPKKMGELWFAMSDMDDILCHVFLAHDFQGTPTPTPEAIPLWVDINQIPWDKMWADDRHWLPHMLGEHKFLGKFIFEEEDIAWKEILLDQSAQAQWKNTP